MCEPSDNERAAKLAHDHWRYISSVLDAHRINDEEINVIGHHYQTAFIHGYKHGQEDAQAATCCCRRSPPTGRPDAEAKEPDSPPKNFLGWVVGNDRGFIKLHKRVNGVPHSIYIGKVWNEDVAETKISTKLWELNLSNTQP